MFDFSRNHFELFGLQPAFGVDLLRLERAYRQIQSEIHPDRFAGAAEAQRRASTQWAGHLNEAYRVLKQPMERALYLLKLQGIDALLETNTVMPPDFLVQQMQWREALASAVAVGDVVALSSLEREINAAAGHLEADLGSQIDVDRDYAAATATVRKLKFLDRLRREIAEASD
jgi:molecular chaperone HscB